MSSTRFVLLGSADDDQAVSQGPRQARHYQQQTGHTCGAAALSMITGLPEATCARLARTTRSGTSTAGVFAALAQLEFAPVHVRFRPEVELERVLPELILQSGRWPLYLALEFREERVDRLYRKRGYSRHHACVLAAGKFLDPAEFHELDPEALGHLHQRGILLHDYVIAAPKDL